MDVSPELYAWLTSLHIVTPSSSTSPSQSSFSIPSHTLELMTAGKYFDVILSTLQTSYNNFYHLNFNYLDSLKDIKPIKDDDEYIAHSIKYYNWQIIVEILSHFGLNYNQRYVVDISNGKIDVLFEIINRLFTLCNELLKRTDPTEEENKAKKNVNSNPANVSSKETINLNTLNVNKAYNECKSPLEFIVVSLCRAFSLKPRQSVALLSNNRKYLSILCNKGMKGSFNSVHRWLDDMNTYRFDLVNILNKWSDGVKIVTATIGTALCSKDPNVVVKTATMLKSLKKDIGIDWEWMISEGIDYYLFAISKHGNHREVLLNVLYDIVEEYINEFIMELKKKIFDGKKKKVFDFFSSVITIIKNINKGTFAKEIESLLYEICLSEKEDYSFSISLLSDAWYNLYPIGDHIQESIMNYFKNAIRNLDNKSALTAISHMFSLMRQFSTDKRREAPMLYKSSVFLMLEVYDNETKKEFYLLQFEKFLNTNQTIPIDIMLNPYMNQIKSCKNYSLSDINFIFKIIEHPRIKSNNIVDIVAFVLRVTLYNLYLARSANLILSLVFEKQFINELCTAEDRAEIYQILVDYIKTSLNLFVKNIGEVEDTKILETPYDILGENIKNINVNVKEDIISGVREYRHIKGKNSSALMGLLWFFDEHDDVLLQIEEEFRVIYPPVPVTVKKKKTKRNSEIKESKEVKVTEEKRTQPVIKEERKDSQTTSKPLSSRRQINKKPEQKKKEVSLQREKSTTLLSPLQQTKKSNNRYESPKTSKSNISSKVQSPQIVPKKPSKLPKPLPRVPSTLNVTNNTSLLSPIPKTSNNTSIIQSKSKRSMMRSSSTGTLLPIQRPKPPLKPLKDDIQEKYGNIISIDRKKQMEAYKQQLFEINKMKMSKELILKEGTIINPNDIYSNNSLSNLSNKARSTYITSEVYNNFILPVNLDEEEDREMKAIKGYNDQYKKNIKLYFRTYADEVTSSISRTNLLKMFRDKKYNQNDLNCDELTIATRNIFGDNIFNFTYEQFCNMLIQLSYLIYTKRRDTLTISECYGNLLRRFVPNKLTDATIKLNRKMKPVIDLIKQKMLHPIDENDSYFNMPPGFKIQEKTSVLYNCRLPPHFVSFLGEGKYVCYELVEEIIFKILNSSTIEPYVKIAKGDEIEIEPGTIKHWTPGMTIAYVKLDTEYEKSGIEVADCLEDAMRKYFKGIKLNGEKMQSQKELKDKEEYEKMMKKEREKEEMRRKRIKEIKDKVEQYKKERSMKLKEKEEKMKEKQLEKMKSLKEQIKQMREMNKKKFEMIRERKKQIEEEKMNKYKEEQEKQKEIEEKKIQQRKEFFNLQQRKLKEQFRLIRTQKEIMAKQNYDQYIQNSKKQESNPAYLQKDKEYMEFEKKLNSTMKSVMEKEDISSTISKYSNHLHIIYDIYSKIGYRTINFYSKEAIRINEFKEFLTNFTILGIVINTEQMNYVFNKITVETEKEKDQQFYLNYDEFVLSLMYIAILSKFSDRTKKILPSDVDNFSPTLLEEFFGFLGLKLPFNKKELDEFINARRALSSKDFFLLQTEMRRHKAKLYRMNEKEREVEEAKQKKIEESNNEYRKKIKQREEDELEERKRRQNSNSNKSRSVSRDRQSKSKSKEKVKEPENQEQENEIKDEKENEQEIEKEIEKSVDISAVEKQEISQNEEDNVNINNQGEENKEEEEPKEEKKSTKIKKKKVKVKKKKKKE